VRSCNAHAGMLDVTRQGTFSADVGLHQKQNVVYLHVVAIGLVGHCFKPQPSVIIIMTSA